MGFSIEPPVLPMLAKRVDAIPPAEGWSFEPKWDGFRAVVFRDGEELLIQSRDGKPLDRYFPELREALLAGLPERCVLDGEIVIADEGGLNFDALQLRVHPAASRVKMLSETTPASVVFFDLLGVGDEDLRAQAFEVRRERLEELMEGPAKDSHAKFAKEDAKFREVERSRLHLTPVTRDRAVAEDWFSRFEGAGLDGVMAKALAGPYTPNKRTMLKVKHERDCDCVVAGFRWHKTGGQTMVGSLLLGLYDAAGRLQHVGTCASFTEAKRKELAEMLEPYRTAPEGHPWAEWGGANAEGSRMPGAKSRWTGTKDLSWELLRPELVVEVAYEHMQGDRFRHLAHFRRWRADKAPESCTYAQLEVVAPQELMEIFKAGIRD
jgi:ATP-dependent DNA ligase